MHYMVDSGETDQSRTVLQFRVLEKYYEKPGNKIKIERLKEDEWGNISNVSMLRWGKSISPI